MKITLITALLVFLTVFFSVPITAQRVSSARSGEADVDAIVNKAAKIFVDNPQAVGLSIGVYKEGKFYTFNFGEVEKGKRQLPTARTLYQIGSITKTFTGMLLAQAVIEKKVKLDDDIRKYLDGNYPNLEYQGQPIRLFHLLNHRSGLPFVLPDDPGTLPGSNQPAPWTPDRVAALLKGYTRQDFYRDLHTVKLNSIPGNSFNYSNAAAQLLGYILERVYGMSYEELVRTKITKPLKMSDTRIALTQSQRIRFVKGYDDKGTLMLPAPGLEAAGALKTSVADMLKYIRWQVGEKDQSVRLSHQPTTGEEGNYSAGLNWQMLRSSGNRVIWQDGSIPGSSSLCAVYPELDMGIIVLSNELDRTTSKRITSLVNDIMETISPRAVALPQG